MEVWGELGQDKAPVGPCRHAGTRAVEQEDGRSFASFVQVGADAVGVDDASCRQRLQ